MMNARAARPAEVGVMVSRTVVAIVRILIASYFLAMATGLVFDPASRTFLDPILPHDQAQFVTTVYLYLTAFAIMVGVLVRPAALLLAVYMFWSGFLFYDLNSAAALNDFWRDMALLGAILMIAVTEQGAGAQVRVWRRKIAPRRVGVPAQDQPHTPRPQPKKAPEGGALLTGVAHASGEIDIYECPPEQDGGDVDNLFADIWEEAETIPVFTHS
ncbi:MAG: hypothetical protein QNJ16_14065 [Rhodobacter sp.]|nr:hypothetical protein [Rhodobacter sp.]